MNSLAMSLDGVAEAVLSSSHARIGVATPASLDVDAIILAKASRIAQSGASVSVVCASRWNAEVLREQAAERYPEGNFDVLFVEEIALRVLEDKGVQEATKRTGRVLDKNEMDVLAEDIKVTGVKIKRLREMLKFFYRSMSDCTAEQEGWLVTQEEQTVFAVLEENLEARRACLPCEVHARAYQGLVASNNKPRPQAFVVDDFGALSASAQRLLEYLSDGRIVAFGNDRFALAADEPYPAPGGMRAFLQDERTEAYSLPEPDRERHAAETQPTPLMEFDHIARIVKDAMDGGQLPDDIVVAAPNKTWCAQIAKALDAAGIGCLADLPQEKVGGDPRESALCSKIKLDAFIKLLRDPDDFTAFRTFVGAGDWLLRSDGFLELLAYAVEHGIGAREAAAQMCDPGNAGEVTASFKKLVGPIREYDELREVWENGTVAQICEAMDAHGLPLGDASSALGEADASPDIGSFLAHVDTKPAARRKGGVLVAPYERVHGHPCKMLVVSGMVDGFMPKRDAVDDAFDIDHRASAMERDRRVLASMEDVASETVRYTNFDHDAIENVASLHMASDRIYTKDGRRWAHIRPSSLLD